jgi:3-dehydroquinate synthase
MISKTLQVAHASGVYSIFIGSEFLDDKQFFNNQIVSTQVCIVTNTQVADLYLDRLKACFSDKRCDFLVLPDGEEHKTFESFLAIIDHLTEQGHHRDTTLVALGGGVIGDMTGFAAACYHRGVAFIQVPTTLLAQVDASIGGKTAINHSKGKNLVGAFYQPNAVVIDLDTLDTLPDREYKSGIAEIIKAALIKDSVFFTWLEQNCDALINRDKNILEEAIYRSCQIKQDVVMRDEKEKGERALLNFGHTFGHAVEHCLGYGEWLHGEAVALGMYMAAHCSHDRGYINDVDFERISQLLTRVGYADRLPEKVTTGEILEAMTHDKKVYKDKLNLILLSSIGSAVIKDDATQGELEQIITHYCSS